MEKIFKIITDAYCATGNQAIPSLVMVTLTGDAVKAIAKASAACRNGVSPEQFAVTIDFPAGLCWTWYNSISEDDSSEFTWIGEDDPCDMETSKSEHRICDIGLLVDQDSFCILSSVKHSGPFESVDIYFSAVPGLEDMINEYKAAASAGNKQTKLIIEVSGGVVTNIVATDDIAIFLVDHDNIKEKGDDTDNARQPFAADLVCSDSEFSAHLESVLANYAK
ncbi:MAG: hypothetical protein ACLQF0_06835 [Dissulfurispiraceae bacterium]